MIVRLAWKKQNSDVSNASLIFLGIFCQIATLPYLWFLFPLFIHSRILFTISGEISVALGEAVIYLFFLKVGLKRSLMLSFFCNAVSFLAGILLHILV